MDGRTTSLGRRRTHAGRRVEGASLRLGRIGLMGCLAVACAGVAAGQVGSYEGDAFPELATPAWERDIQCMPERWLDSGWLVESVEVGQCGPPPGGDRERYLRSLADMAGTPTFFVEWRMVTDGHRDEIVGVAPASLVLGGVP